MSDGLTLFPVWRQAVKDFLKTFHYGDVVTHQWLEEHFGMPAISDDKAVTREEFRELQFEWLANIEQFKSELLREHSICLQSVRGKGYRWVPPAEQTDYAVKEFERDARKVFRSAGNRLRHVRVGELTDDQRRENIDATAKLTALSGMSRKLLA